MNAFILLLYLAGHPQVYIPPAGSGGIRDTVVFFSGLSHRGLSLPGGAAGSAALG